MDRRLEQGGSDRQTLGLLKFSELFSLEKSFKYCMISNCAFVMRKRHNKISEGSGDSDVKWQIHLIATVAAYHEEYLVWTGIALET